MVNLITAVSIKRPQPCTVNNNKEEWQETQKREREIENKENREDKKNDNSKRVESEVRKQEYDE